MTTPSATSLPSRGSGRPSVRRRAGRRPLPLSVAFWSVAATTATLLAASSAPSPLYQVYQAEFGFSSVTLTAIFAVYVLALLLSLLTVGRLSTSSAADRCWPSRWWSRPRRWASSWARTAIGALFAARVVQGLATGAAVGVLGAYLLDLQPATVPAGFAGEQRGRNGRPRPGRGAGRGPDPVRTAADSTHLRCVRRRIPVLARRRRCCRRRSGDSRAHGPRCGHGCSFPPPHAGRSCGPRRPWHRRGCWADSCSRSADRCWP